MRRLHFGLLGSLVLAPTAATQRTPDLPVTVAEQSGFTRTSRLEDVRAFLGELAGLPAGERLEVGVFGESHEGRDLLIVRVRGEEEPAEERLRVLVVANIHGGEVCGKEALQMLLREVANGEHRELLRACDLWCVPIYNVDGNERIAASNRSSVNGPVEGLGERENAQGFDLNRDCIKAESPEFRALLGLLAEFDPHLLLDLHTTDGSPHGWHLTYAPPLCTNVDPAIVAFLRETHLPAVRQASLERHGYRVYDYGNFGRGDVRVYRTFDHRPRFLTNYHGLRNRLAVLSEAYAYEPFEVRVRATRAFVIENLRAAVRERATIRAMCAAADERAERGAVSFACDTEFAAGFEDDIPVARWDTAPSGGRGARLMRRSELDYERMRVQVAFESKRSWPLSGGGWALPDAEAALVEVLRAHGVRLLRLGAPVHASIATFEPTSGDKARREFQGHREIRLRGEWRETAADLPAGTLVVASHQRLARLAAQLLEPESEDGLVTWNFLEARTRIAADGVEGAFPIVRLATLDGLDLEPY